MKGAIFVIFGIFLLKCGTIQTSIVTNLPDFCTNEGSVVICDKLNFDFVEDVEIESDQRGSYRTLVLQNAISLRRIPKGIANLSQEAITTLSVLECKLNVLDEGDLNGFEGLYKLIIRGNSLRTLSDYVFRKLSVLQMLDLQLNEIENLSPNTFFGLSSLIHLNLGDNSIKTLPVGVFFPLILVHEIYLDANGIRYVPTNTFANNTVLQTLSLKNNNIDFEKNFDFLSYLKTIKTLDLSENALLRQIHEPMFANARNLEELDLSRNQLTYFRMNAFYSAGKLRNLNMTSNNLQSFKIKFLSKCKSLEYLGLENNPLKEIDFELYQNYTPHLKRVDLLPAKDVEVDDCALFLKSIDLMKSHGVEVSFKNCTSEPVTSKPTTTNAEDAGSKEICIGVAAGIFGFAIVSITLGFLLYRAKHRVSRL